MGPQSNLNVPNGSLTRRSLISGCGASLALPALEAFAAPTTSAAAGPRNFVAVGTYLGWHQNAFFPKQEGALVDLPETLQPLAGFEKDFTVFSGLDHRAPNGHNAWGNFLCGQSPKDYSLDQIIADQVGAKTRIASLEITAGAGEGSKFNMSFTKDKIGLPRIIRPSVLYRKLFTSKEDQARAEYLLKTGKSALDDVSADARRLQSSLPASDRDKLEEYFSSLRAVETKMTRQLARVNDPVPTTDYPFPEFDTISPNLQIEAETMMYDLIALALETGSTHVASLFLDGLGQVFSIDGKALSSGYHGLSHHGNVPEMINDLIKIEQAHFHCFAGFLEQLKNKKTLEGKSLLDDTIILMGTGMGDASRHSNANLPTLVAGGGFKHGNHIAIDSKKRGEVLLGDLYITLMQKMGLEKDRFSNASHNINQLFS
ncbi:MAG: DUF1552 domain-containing protein [Verrucomicrobiota bacterium]